MRENIEYELNYLELGEDNDICQRISKIRKYIEEINKENERLKIRNEMLELINFHLIRKEYNNEK